MKLCPQSTPQLVSRLVEAPPRRIVVSGPSGFLGARILDVLLQTHQLREEAGREPGELVLLSSSPGRLMSRIGSKYGHRIKTIRASRVDYFTQHDKAVWRDHLGSLGVGGHSESVFLNLAAVAGPQRGGKDAMQKVNYEAAIAAAAACEDLGVSHFIQSSTQATNSERAGQVPYSRGKAMADFHLASQIRSMPVTIACVGLLYCRESRSVGQDLGPQKLNLIDLSVLPFTPIMGSGRAPIQPQEVWDAALRFACLAFMDPATRPKQVVRSSKRLQRLQSRSGSAAAHPEVQSFLDSRSAAGGGGGGATGLSSGSIYSSPPPRSRSLRIYDAVGPQTMSMKDMLTRFGLLQGNRNFRPVHIDYRNMESILNIMSLGNLNRQFVSLLRSEQDNLKGEPFIGDPTAWDQLAGPDEGARMTDLDDILPPADERGHPLPIFKFPFFTLIKLVVKHPKVILPGIRLTMELAANCIAQGVFMPKSKALSAAQQEALFLVQYGNDLDVSEVAVSQLRKEFEKFDVGKKGELDEHEAMLLMEAEWSRVSQETTDNDGNKKPGSPDSFQQLRDTFDEMDMDGNGQLSFMEWACIVFGKDAAAAAGGGAGGAGGAGGGEGGAGEEGRDEEVEESERREEVAAEKPKVDVSGVEAAEVMEAEGKLQSSGGRQVDGIGRGSERVATG